MTYSYYEGATCAMCGWGVHDLEGRVACDRCNLPTDCCLCPQKDAHLPVPTRRRA